MQNAEPTKTPPSEQLEARPGMNVLFGKQVLLKIRVWREKEQRWHEVPEDR